MSKPTCAICKRPVEDPAYKPFCSRRCADLDLQRWFSGAYAVPAVEAEDGEAAGGEAGRGWSDPL
ncbi:DNA gyrase inhibitor YacG [Caulobacter sp. S45]|uniref:DNA gyrase inhibitor YacG n=1 Tax=Caulobacter sp. S45 TaxID=1641861 RepID=UPI001576580D|nr:DNA gyrase inhibitor YacG [Caulobacter sp. S45]